MPSISLARRRPTGLSVTTRIAVSTVVLTILASTVASAQTAETIREFGLFPTIGLRLVGGIVGNFVAGGLLVALAPRFARERVRAIRDDPGSTFVWGLLTGIGVPILLALAAVTIIGLLIAIPGYLLLIPVGIAGTGVTILWLGGAVCRATDAASDHPLLVGSAATGVIYAVPFLGDFVISVLTFLGLGSVGKALYEGYRD